VQFQIRRQPSEEANVCRIEKQSPAIALRWFSVFCLPFISVAKLYTTNTLSPQLAGVCGRRQIICNLSGRPDHNAGSHYMISGDHTSEQATLGWLENE
jgi:hypothetical protein